MLNAIIITAKWFVIKLTSQNIDFLINFILAILNDEVEFRQFLDLTSLTTSQSVLNVEILQISMISKDLNWNSAAFKFRTSLLEAFNNNQKLLVVNLVVAFSEKHFVTIKDNWMKLIIFTHLRENVFDNIVREIDF